MSDFGIKFKIISLILENKTIPFVFQNKFQLAKETNIFIHLIDVNDNIPVFVSDDGSSLSHSVLENEDPGTIVMQVKAVDADSSDAHNQVMMWHLLEHFVFVYLLI